MRCIECGAGVESLYTEYSKENFRLTQCPKCLKFADKYIEFDYVVLAIDVLLLKPQVYRHLLFNTLVREDGKLDPRVRRLGLLLLLFDICISFFEQLIIDLTWFRVERDSQSFYDPALLIHRSIMTQYVYYFSLSLIEFITFHATARGLSSSGVKGQMISTALLISSCARLVPVFMVIWSYDIPEAAGLVDCVVLVYNTEALRILLECGYLQALLIALAATFMRTIAGMLLIKVTVLQHQPGLSRDAVSAIMSLWRRVELTAS